MNCPNCQSNRFFYVERVYTYKFVRVSATEDNKGQGEEEYIEDGIIDSTYTPHFECTHCDNMYDLNLKKITDDQI